MSRWSDRFSSGAAAGEAASTKQSSHSSFNELTVSQLKHLCSQNGIDVNGLTLKQQLIDALIKNEVPVPMSSMRFVETTDVRKQPTTATATAARSKLKPQEEDPQTPRTVDSNIRVTSFERQGKVWFGTEFLEAALNERLDQTKGVAQQNPTPTLFILVGPASVGKSSAKLLIPEMGNNVVNVDVDEIKLYGNEKLPQHPNPNKPGEMLSDVEGIQFKYDLVLEKLRPMVFQRATMFGPGQYKNIILDTTGSMSDQIKMYIRMAKQTYSYTVKVIIVYSEKLQCLQRVNKRNTQLFQSGLGTRYIPPRVVSSIYDTFLKKNQAYFYAIGDRMSELTDELILVDNRTKPRIVATRTRSELQIFPYVMGEDSIVGVDGAFYGLTLIPPEGGQPASIVQGDLQSQIHKAQSEWTEFEIAEKTAAAAKAAEATTGIGGSRKRRVSRRRLHGSRVRKTVKKYYRPSTRRRRHQRRHSHRRGYS